VKRHPPTIAQRFSTGISDHASNPESRRDERCPRTATFNAATRELTVPAMPDHASFLRAKRQPAGGPESDAGVSNTPTVSVVGIAPLTPGVSYTVWVVGVNSRGEGPESNKITFVA
jgi:hypothetical protein